MIRRRAIEAAETDLLQRRVVTTPAKEWPGLEAWASAPAKGVPALGGLAKTLPLWQQ